MPARMIAVRLRESYENLATTVADYALLADKVLCYEHPVPGNIHCHLLLTGVRQTDETLRNVFRRHGLVLKGAGQNSYKETFKQDKQVIPITDETIPKYVTYMTKGQYDAKYSKGFTPEELDSLKAKWITYEKSVKQTRDQNLLDGFYNEMLEYSKPRNIDVHELYTNVPAVRTLALRFAVDSAHGIINTQTRKDAAMLYTSVCYKSGALTALNINLAFEKLK